MLTYIKETNQQVYIRKFSDVSPIGCQFKLDAIDGYEENKTRFMSMCSKLNLNVVSMINPDRPVVVGVAELVGVDNGYVVLDLFIIEAQITEEYFYNNFKATIGKCDLSWGVNNDNNWSVIVTAK